MKALKFLLLLLPLILLSSCDRLVGEPVEQKIYGKMGFNSILNYRYMQYTGDSATLILKVEEYEPAMRHYNKSAIYNGSELVAQSDTLPFETEVVIPIIDDSAFTFKHICWIDTLSSFSDTLDHRVYIHKSEVVNHTPDTVSIVRERLDSVIVRTYYHNPNKFWWL